MFFLGAAVLLSGCKGVPTEGEKQARKDVQAVARTYRPHGDKPRLPELNENSGLSNYLTFAMLNQPKVEAAYYDWLASVERITQARSVPDPQFSFQMDVQNAVTSVMPGLMGAIPWPDKLRVAAQVASEESRGKYFLFQSAVLESAFEVKRAYYQLYFLAEKIRVNRETGRLLHELEDSARFQNEAGKGTLQDVLRIQMEQDRSQTEMLNLEHSRAALLAQFKAALGLKVDDSTPALPARFESASRELPAEKILETAIAENKRLKSMETEIRSAAASITLARRSRLPDFTLGLMVDVKANPTLYRFPGNPGTISLPIWRDKIAAQIAEAQFNKRSAEARLSAQEIAVGLDFVEKWHVYQETSDTLDLLEYQLLPKARQSLEFARANYPSGQTDFASIAEASRALLNFELEKVDSAAQREIVLAELSLIVQGMPPTSGSMTSAKPMTSQPAAQKRKAGGM